MQLTDIKHVAVIGTGIMGSGIGIEFARFGYEVSLYDVNETAIQNATTQAREDLDIMVEMQLLNFDEAKAAYARLHPTSDFVKATSKADYVLEAVPERLHLKQEIFTRLDEICQPAAILASTTSMLSATDIASATKHPERILVTHYYSPPDFMPLVEVFGGEKTDPQVVDTVVQLLRRLRKKVVIIKNERLRQVGNLMQSALSNEIHKQVDMGIPVKDIDDVITFGFGRRLPFQGYFKRMDQVGLDGRLERYVAGGMKPWPPILERVNRGELGVKTGKGFYDWPGDTAKQLNHRLNMELARLMKYDMDEGLI